MSILDKLFETARNNPRHIILPEGDDPRVQDAARRITDEGLADITLLSSQPVTGLRVIDPLRNDDLARLTEAYLDLRKAKGMTAEKAAATMAQPIAQAAMRVRMGLADGTVGGAVATTSDTVRAALQIIGLAPGARVVSSFFLMSPPAEHPVMSSGFIFADCALVIEPSADELTSIALDAAQSCRQMLGEEPRVALLSFSTAGSARHESITTIQSALSQIRSIDPDLEIDGELQFDAAIDASIRARKAPDSCLSASPNVFVFPNLAAGNIGYKIAQRLGGIDAIGPILQGLAKPANDLSRGCTVDDIVSAVVLTALQVKDT